MPSQRSWTFILYRWLAVSLLLALAACGPAGPQFMATDITGADIGGSFQLTDHTGKPRTLADFRGKVVVVFFGYTHCPDACPTTMSELAGAMKQLGDRAKEVQVLFVTVDPERDSQQLLAQYVPAFHPSFIGLTGSDKQIRAVADSFKVVFQRASGQADEKNYSVDHSTGSYIFDKTGKIRVFVNYGSGGTVFAHDLGVLLAA
ncbi:SCO family protein [Chitinimonas sp.]|uniref:SCO family protein n=1 Tax=Chitinimonas sp. TaxID=1934313 RepID=UPI0035B3533A